jgi:hypothetical protein
MKIYAHRGNMEGPSEWENSPSLLKEAMEEKFYVEVDCWYHEDKWWFGHDRPEHPVTWDFVEQHKYQMILHAKDFITLKKLRTRDVHHFYHENDPYTLTSQNWVWMYPTDELPYDYLTVMALPEQAGLLDVHMLSNDIGGVCTDYPNNWRNK